MKPPFTRLTKTQVFHTVWYGPLLLFSVKHSLPKQASTLAKPASMVTPKPLSFPERQLPTLCHTPWRLMLKVPSGVCTRGAGLSTNSSVNPSVAKLDAIQPVLNPGTHKAIQPQSFSSTWLMLLNGHSLISFRHQNYLHAFRKKGFGVS